jgi:very-short-patch-repair endonuclease
MMPITKRRRTRKIQLAPLPRIAPTFGRRLSKAPSWAEELQEYAIPQGALRGDATILDRMIARRLNDLDVSYTFQYPMNLAGLREVRVDFACWNTGFNPFLGIEGDGYIWHMDVEADEERDALLYAEGVTNVHLHEADMMHSKERFLYVMDQALLGIQQPRPPGTVRTITFTR